MKCTCVAQGHCQELHLGEAASTLYFLIRCGLKDAALAVGLWLFMHPYDVQSRGMIAHLN